MLQACVLQDHYSPGPPRLNWSVHLRAAGFCLVIVGAESQGCRVSKRIVASILPVFQTPTKVDPDAVAPG